MAKKKSATASLSINGKEVNMDAIDKLLTSKRNFEIAEARIKDDFCSYSYNITSGVGSGDTHKVKGTGIVDRDMHNAFARLNVHLAAIDDVFKHSGIEIEDIDKFHGHELTTLYSVSGIKFGGSEENESVTLIGNKYITSAAGRIEIETPKIFIGSGSGYKFYNELKADADVAKEEVALYAEGKCTHPESDDDQGESPEIDFETKVTEEQEA